MEQESVTALLQRKYQATGSNTVTDWMSRNKVDISLQSCTTVLLRGQTKGFQVMLTLAACLGCTADELKWVAKECGDKTLWRYIATQEDFTSEERALINVFRQLNSEQRQLITTMTSNLAPKSQDS